MADLAATKFPGDTGSTGDAIRNVLVSGDNIFQMTATTAVVAGQVVAIHATGVSLAVDPSVAAAGSRSVGVALYNAAAGAEVAIAGPGCIVYAVNAIDSAIDAGAMVETNDAACKGGISEAAIAAVSGAVGTNHLDIIGIALEDIAASTTSVGTKGRILICPMTLAQLNDA